MSSRGFTLIEALVAILVFSFVVIGTTQLLSFSAEEVSESYKFNRAVLLAMSRREYILAHYSPDNCSTLNGKTESIDNFSIKYSVQNTESLKVVKIDVSWDEENHVYLYAILFD